MSGKVKTPVLVTGFAPFGIHEVNISWELAKILPSLNFDSHEIDLIIEEIPVVYSVVSEEVPALWNKHKPKLTIHMGVHSSTSVMVIETNANRDGYTSEDELGKLPENGSAKGEKSVIHTKLDVKDVCDQITNSTDFTVPVEVSTNAGKYLCEFTYYTSLNIDNSKVVFIHVPDFNKEFPLSQMADVVKKIILILLDQMENSPNGLEDNVVEDNFEVNEV